jgi:hypothetical protein
MRLGDDRVARKGSRSRKVSEIDLALSLNPRLDNLFGTNRIYSGQPLEAIPQIEHAMRLDPALVRNSSSFLVWHICLQETTKQRPRCSERIFLVLFLLLP